MLVLNFPVFWMEFAVSPLGLKASPDIVKACQEWWRHGNTRQCKSGGVSLSSARNRMHAGRGCSPDPIRNKCAKRIHEWIHLKSLHGNNAYGLCTSYIISMSISSSIHYIILAFGGSWIVITEDIRIINWQRFWPSKVIIGWDIGWGHFKCQTLMWKLTLRQSCECVWKVSG